jgi:hypothetical protein
MSKEQTVVADAVASTFTLSATLSEQLAIGAEKIVDSGFDFRDGCEIVAGVFKEIKDSGQDITFVVWEGVRKYFEQIAAVRARDNGAINPEGAGNDAWLRFAGYLKEFHSLTKPRSAEPGSVAKSEKREAEKAKLLAVAAGRSAAELEQAKRELYSQASDESIAQAKAIEKAQTVVATLEKAAVSTQVKPLVSAANNLHKEILKKYADNPTALANYVVALKKFEA